MRKAKKAAHERAALLHRRAEFFHRDALAVALHLHEDLAGRTIRVEHDRQPGHALKTDNRDLRLLALASADSHDRGEPAFGEVRMRYPAVCRLQTLAELERDMLQMRRKQREVCARQTVEDAVALLVAYQLR